MQKKTMNIREFRMYVLCALEYAKRSENLREDGSVNWDYVSADLHIINDIGEFDLVDIECVLDCAANGGVSFKFASA